MVVPEDPMARLERALDIASLSRGHRFLKRPWHLGSSKVMELALFRPPAVYGTTFWGDDLELVFPDRVSLSIHRYGFFEADATSFLARYLQPGMTFLDVGAHIGYFSALARWRVGPEGLVHAFEPTPRTFDVLSRNLGAYPNVFFNRSAAAAKAGSASFVDYGPRLTAFNTMAATQNIAATRLEEREVARATHEVIQIDTVMLDQYVTDHGLKVDCLKIDAEGSEADVLQGASELLRREGPVVVLEVGDVGSAGETLASSELVEKLTHFGYRPFECRRGHLVEHGLRRRYEHMNLIFLTDEHPLLASG